MALPNDKLITCTRLESEWIQNGGCNEPTPFAIKHGRTLFDYTRDDTGYNRLFNEAMASDTPSATSVVIEHFKGGLRGLKSLVDSNLASAQLRSKKSNTDPRFRGWTRAPGVLQAKNQSGHAREAGQRPSMECSMENSRLEQQKNFLNNTCDELAVRKENGDPTLENVQSIVLVVPLRQSSLTLKSQYSHQEEVFKLTPKMICCAQQYSSYKLRTAGIHLSSTLLENVKHTKEPIGDEVKALVHSSKSNGVGLVYLTHHFDGPARSGPSYLKSVWASPDALGRPILTTLKLRHAWEARERPNVVPLGRAREAEEWPNITSLGGRGNLDCQTGETVQMGHFWAKLVCYSPRFQRWDGGPGVWVYYKLKVNQGVQGRLAGPFGWSNGQNGANEAFFGPNWFAIAHDSGVWAWGQGMMWVVNRSGHDRDAGKRPSVVRLGGRG
ncbi:glycoalkaloid metabolism 1 precursor [Capsicum annuum]|nr:glycoalkaloid metabolism 1 precursor [Capsicum annuum]